MFINSDNIGDESNNHGRTALLFIGFAIILLIIIVGLFFVIKFISIHSNSNINSTAVKDNKDVATTTGLKDFVPLGKNVDNTDKKKNVVENKKEENLLFGNFYHAPTYSNVKFSFDDYTLPLNAKIDVSNYYDVNRKIGLDDVNNELNKDGFVILSDSFSKYGNDFYSVLGGLQKDGVPLVITTDLLNYYYQNVIQESYKAIENELFFSNLWEVSKTLYKQSKARYENLYRENKMTNSPFLEASRLETAYLAVILKLLSPTDKQISNMKLSDENSFTAEDAKKFSVSLPTYLQVDVNKEVNLILNHSKIKGQARSPVLKYYKDYNYFNVPKAYEGNIRLNNFYLASQWMHSIFPLYYRSKQCQNCLLDKEDWRISFLSSLLLSHDFSVNQTNENKWAQIYKTVSFFKGLRDNIIYIDMDLAMKKVLGNDYNLKDNFLNADIDTIDSKVSKIQANLISNFKENDMRGRYDYTSTSSRVKIGMRMLNEPYVPTEYFNKQFTFPSTGIYLGSKEEGKLYLTNCDYNQKNYVKCLGSDLDMLNLFIDVGDKPFINSVDYKFYDKRKQEAQLWLNDFNKYAWHDSNYWSTLYPYKAYLDYGVDNMPIFMRQDKWSDRVSNFVLGSLVYAQADNIDKLSSKNKNISTIGEGLSSSQSDVSVKYAYIEPNLVFIKETSANLKMLKDMFLKMGISNKVDFVQTNLNEAVGFFDNITNIVEKELNGENLTDDDYDFISEFANRYEMVEHNKSIIKSKKALTRELDGVRLLLIIYDKNGKKILAGGPVYNYKEEK